VRAGFWLTMISLFVVTAIAWVLVPEIF